MLLPLDMLGWEKLRPEIETQFGVRAPRAAFVPEGRDSWSFHAGDLWVSVRRDLRGHYPAAYEAAYELRRSGLDFVLAPLPGADGRIVRRVEGFPVVVFPYLPVSPLASRVSKRESHAIVEMMRQVHACRVVSRLPRETYTFSFDGDLSAALEFTGHDAISRGPYSISLHRLLRHNQDRIAAARAELGRLAAVCATTGDRLVLTHGEPNADNVLRHAGRLLLGDWGGAMWGPPERDWFHVARAAGTSTTCRPEFLRFYEIRWYLGEIAEYATRFIREHAGDADDHAMWRDLLTYLPEHRR